MNIVEKRLISSNLSAKRVVKTKKNAARTRGVCPKLLDFFLTFELNLLSSLFDLIRPIRASCFFSAVVVGVFHSPTDGGTPSSSPPVTNKRNAIRL